MNCIYRYGEISKRGFGSMTMALELPPPGPVVTAAKAVSRKKARLLDIH